MAYRKITNKELGEKAAALAALQQRAEQIDDQIEALKAEITAELDRREVEEVTAEGFLMRWTRYLTSRLDSKALKAALPDVAAQYTRSTEARRFTVTAA